MKICQNWAMFQNENAKPVSRAKYCFSQVSRFYRPSWRKSGVIEPEVILRSLCIIFINKRRFLSSDQARSKVFHLLVLFEILNPLLSKMSPFRNNEASVRLIKWGGKGFQQKGDQLHRIIFIINKEKKITKYLYVKMDFTGRNETWERYHTASL